MDPKKNQIEIAERLQLMLLQRWETLLNDGTLCPTDAATLARFLRENGWSVDASKIPESLRGLLTADVDPKRLDDDDLYPGGAH
jgi:hypothetical protein